MACHAASPSGNIVFFSSSYHKPNYKPKGLKMKQLCRWLRCKHRRTESVPYFLKPTG